MAAIMTLAGGMVGFASAVACFLLLNVSLLMALAIWSGVGMGMMTLGIILSLLGPRAAEPGRRMEAQPRIA